MPKSKQIQISVKTVFDGKLDGRQTLIELILKKNSELYIASKPTKEYNASKVFSNVRVT